MDVHSVLCSVQGTLGDAIRIVDSTSMGTVLVVDADSRLVGRVGAAEIHAAGSARLDLAAPVASIMRANPAVLFDGYSGAALAAAGDTGVWIPIVDTSGCPIRLVHRDGESSPLARHVALIGGAGYIGSIATRLLLEAGYRVTVYDAFLYGDDSIADLRAHPNLTIIQGDTRDIDGVMGTIWNADAVVHLAELVGDPLCARDPKVTSEINYLATSAIAHAVKALHINRFLYVSSCSVYGASAQPDTILREGDPMAPVSLYAKLKIASEQVIQGLAGDGFSPCVFRLGTVFGMSYRPRFDLVVNTFTGQAMQHGKLSVFGGDQWRPNVHVADVARAIVLALETPLAQVAGETLNIIGENFTIDAIAAQVAEVVGNVEVASAATLVDRRNYRVSGDRAAQVIGFQPQMTVRAGIAEVADAIRAGRIGDFTDLRYSNLSAFSRQPASA